MQRVILKSSLQFTCLLNKILTRIYLKWSLSPMSKVKRVKALTMLPILHDNDIEMASNYSGHNRISNRYI